MRNKYPGYCCRCGTRVEKGEGHFEKTQPGNDNCKLHKKTRNKWVLRCTGCVGKGHE